MKKVLCFGDSNTWGYNPVNGERFEVGQRWTSLVQERFGDEVCIMEEGLCGRTSVYEDRTRPNRKGIVALRHILEENKDIDVVVLMLGTNDCKSYYGNSAREITQGIEDCLNLILDQISEEKVVLVSPIQLGEYVWQDAFDPEFNQKSVGVSKELKAHYNDLANKKGIHFLAASDYVSPSDEDQEHMSLYGHRVFANAIFDKLQEDVLYKRELKPAV